MKLDNLNINKDVGRCRLRHLYGGSWDFSGPYLVASKPLELYAPLSYDDYFGTRIVRKL